MICTTTLETRYVMRTEPLSWQHSLWAIWAAQLLSVAAMEMVSPFWPLFLGQQGDLSAAELQFWSALAYLLPLAGAVLTAPLWGRLGDRYGHKWMFLRALLVLGLTQALILYSQSLWMVVFSRLLQGLFAGSIAAAQSYALRQAPSTEQGFALGRLQSAVAGGALLGPLLGGALAQYQGYLSLFAAGALLNWLPAVALLIWLPRDYGCRPSVSRGAEPEERRTGWPQIMILILLAIALAQLAKRMPGTFFSLYAQQELLAAEFLIGVLYAASGLTVLLTSARWGRWFDRQSAPARQQALILLSLASALTLIWQSFATDWVSALVVRLLWGCWLGGLLPLLFAQLRQFTGQSGLGHLIGIGHSASKSGGALGVALGALVVAFIEPRYGFLAIALVYLLLAVVLWRAGKQQPDLKTETPKGVVENA